MSKYKAEFFNMQSGRAIGPYPEVRFTIETHLLFKTKQKGEGHHIGKQLHLIDWGLEAK